MIKFRYFFNFDKEEQWLNQMAEQGYLLVRKGELGYRFISVPPKQQNIKVDYREFKNEKDFIDYCTLFSDSGWQHIAGKRKSGTQYFMNINSDANEDIFSDMLSREGRYKRILKVSSSFSLVFFSIIILIFNDPGFVRLDGFRDFRALYYTPGLWELNGSAFWRSFLFETPIALIRGFSGITLAVLILILFATYSIIAIKSWWFYRKALNEAAVE